ncbi:MAG: chromate transporter [Acholeplasmataceae bacterium]|nr:chromate transporter [Acholeplasmataceae bacterium]
MILTLLNLFWMFFKIGLFTFGGGYAMIPLIRDELVGGGYISADALINFIGISESTPGPVAVNMATFIGFSQFQNESIFYALFGAFATTLGVILPSFIIILLIASLGSKFLQSKIVNHAFLGLKPVVIGLIISVSAALMVRAALPNIDFENLIFDFSQFNYKGLIILIIVGAITLFYKKMSPIKIILLSAILGMLIYGLIP